MPVTVYERGVTPAKDMKRREICKNGRGEKKKLYTTWAQPKAQRTFGMANKMNVFLCRVLFVVGLIDRYR